MANNDLNDFMQTLTREIGDEYNRIQKRSTEDPGTAGDQGEENWATIFRNWLPADYQVVTKGRLLNEKGIAGPQVDVIILRPFYPKHLLDKKLYLTAGVAAAFECKNTLKSEHIDKAVKNSVVIQNLIDIRPSNYRKELYSPIIYGLIAHTHSWKSESSKPLEIIQKKLIHADNLFVTHPRACLDFICVSDLGLWSIYKQPFTAQFTMTSDKPILNWGDGVQTAYGQSSIEMFWIDSEQYLSFTPIGAFLSRLFYKLAITDERLKDFSKYFGQAIGGGSSFIWRNWPENTLSKESKDDYYKNLESYKKEEFLL